MPLNAFADTSRTLVWIGRALLLLSAASLTTMPLTQHLWTWDRFLHGGQDFELGTLMVVIFLSLVIVLLKQCNWCVDLLFARRRLAGVNLTRRERMTTRVYGMLWAIQPEPVPCTPLALYSIPMQI